MGRRPDAAVTCPVCRQIRRSTAMVPGDLVRDSLLADIEAEHPRWTAEQSICSPCLARYRADHVRRLLEQEKGELSQLEQEVIRSLREQESISANINVEFETQLTFGERLADRMTQFGGSWTFILVFFGLLMVWVGINTVALAQGSFDPYPFILLNLVLSCLAAIQAPIIMMSQNRREAKDRMRAEHDYQVNLKAELEVRLLHAKLDQLLTHQWQRLLEIQQMQMDLMEDVAKRDRPAGRPSTGDAS